MKLLMAAVLTLLALPASAADWTHYVNPRFGYAIDVPPDFVSQGEADNGDGQVFSTPTTELRTFGAYILEGDFETEIRQRLKFATDEGWKLTYQVTTPRYASFSAVSGSRVLHARFIALCGNAVGAFVLTYWQADIPKFNAIIDRLVVSLKPTAGSAACPFK